MADHGDGERGAGHHPERTVGQRQHPFGMQILGKYTDDEVAKSFNAIYGSLHPSPGGRFVVPPPLGASIQAIVSPDKNEGSHEVGYPRTVVGPPIWKSSALG